MRSWLKPDERLDDLQRCGLRIIQNPKFYSFSMDPILLTSFANVKERDVVVDLGTGTGVIPLLLWAKYHPARIVAIEIQPELADMAQRSVIYNDLEDYIDVIEGDLKDTPAMFDHDKVDVVVTNPPYDPVGSGPINESPIIANARREILSTLDDVIAASSRILKSRGKLAMVHKAERLSDIMTQMRDRKIEPKRLRFVHPHQKSQAGLILIEGIKDGGRGLRVLPPLFIYGPDGSYSEEIDAIYQDTNRPDRNEGE